MSKIVKAEPEELALVEVPVGESGAGCGRGPLGCGGRPPLAIAALIAATAPRLRETPGPPIALFDAPTSDGGLVAGTEDVERDAWLVPLVRAPAIGAPLIAEPTIPLTV